VSHPRSGTAIGIFRFVAVATGNDYGLFSNVPFTAPFGL
jgi:hypothetical protein